MTKNASLYSADSSNPDLIGKEETGTWMAAISIAACRSVLAGSNDAQITAIQKHVLPPILARLEEVLDDPYKAMALRFVVKEAQITEATIRAESFLTDGDLEGYERMSDIANRSEQIAKSYLTQLASGRTARKRQEEREKKLLDDKVVFNNRCTQEKRLRLERDRARLEWENHLITHDEYQEVYKRWEQFMNFRFS